MAERAIESEIVTGTHVGKRVSLPRIVLSPIVLDHPFILKRKQFPIRVCYAMTINKRSRKHIKMQKKNIPIIQSCAYSVFKCKGNIDQRLHFE